MKKKISFIFVTLAVALSIDSFTFAHELPPLSDRASIELSDNTAQSVDELECVTEYLKLVH